jgi:hypothetical protein
LLSADREDEEEQDYTSASKGRSKVGKLTVPTIEDTGVISLGISFKNTLCCFLNMPEWFLL